MTITKGLLTYKAEGQEGGIFHSRKLHVPSDNSGLTIGRGYDMKGKESYDIIKDLTDAGLSHPHSKLLSTASGLFGDNAKKFIAENHGLDIFTISIEQQEELFRISYAEMEADVMRICNKADCVEAYGAVDWNKLDPDIKEVIIDLRFRGDYHPTSRRLIQKYVSKNNLGMFTKNLCDRELWENVPEDRFNRRAEFLLKAIKPKDLFINKDEIEIFTYNNISEIDKLNIASGSMIKALIQGIEKNGIYIRLSNATKEGHKIDYEHIKGDKKTFDTIAKALGLRMTKTTIEVNNNG